MSKTVFLQFHEKFTIEFSSQIDIFENMTFGHVTEIFSTILNDDYRPWDYPENLGICSRLDRESKTWFFTFLNVYIFWIERGKILISQLSPQKIRYFADQRGIFKWINEFPKQLGLEKHKKNGVICLVFMSPSWVMVLKLPKIVLFCWCQQQI